MLCPGSCPSGTTCASSRTGPASGSSSPAWRTWSRIKRRPPRCPDRVRRWPASASAPRTWRCAWARPIRAGLAGRHPGRPCSGRRLVRQRGVGQHPTGRGLWLAQARLDRASLLARRARSGDRAEASRLANLAASAGERAHLRRILLNADDLLAGLDRDRVAPEAEPSGADQPTAADDVGSLPPPRRDVGGGSRRPDHSGPACQGAGRSGVLPAPPWAAGACVGTGVPAGRGALPSAGRRRGPRCPGAAGDPATPR